MFGLVIHTAHTPWYVFCKLPWDLAMVDMLRAQVDKLFNPFTLLVGPTLVAIIVWKSTKSVENGGFHLPWW